MEGGSQSQKSSNSDFISLTEAAAALPGRSRMLLPSGWISRGGLAMHIATSRLSVQWMLHLAGCMGQCFQTTLSSSDSQSIEISLHLITVQESCFMPHLQFWMEHQWEVSHWYQSAGLEQRFDWFFWNFICYKRGFCSPLSPEVILCHLSKQNTKGWFKMLLTKYCY